MKRYAIICIVLLVLIVGTVQVLGTAGSGLPLPASDPPAAASAPLKPLPAEKSGSAASASTTDVAASPDSGPAWLRPAHGPVEAAIGSTDAEVEADSALSKAQTEKIARLSEVMTKFEKLRAQPNISSREVAAAITDLERVNGSPVMSGIRLDLLRENVMVAGQMQQAAEEIQKLQKSPDARSPDTVARVESKVAELESLKSRLRSDIMQPDAGATAR